MFANIVYNSYTDGLCKQLELFLLSIAFVETLQKRAPPMNYGGESGNQYVILAIVASSEACLCLRFVLAAMAGETAAGDDKSSSY